MIVSRDEEEIFIMTFENYKEKKFFGEITLSSNYAFEYPYIVYVRNRENIFIHSVFEEEKLFLIKGKDYLKEGEFISCLHVTHTYEIFFLVDSGDKYKLYRFDAQCLRRRKVLYAEC